MKKYIVLILVAVLASCTAKKKSAAPENVTQAQLQAAKTKFSDVTMDQLKNGYTIYNNGACTNCHGAKSITSRDEAAWTGIMDRMAPKAHLTPTEREAVWRYIMAVKLASNS